MKTYFLIATKIFITGLFFTLFVNSIYGFSHSNCNKYDILEKKSTIVISYETFEKMINSCENQKDDIYYFLKDMREQIAFKMNAIEKFYELVFYYNSKGLQDCNIYLRTYSKGRHSFETIKFMEFQKKINDITEEDCKHYSSGVFSIFLEAIGSYIKQADTKSLDETFPFVDMYSIEINKVISRHLEMEQYLKKRGINIISMPILVRMYSKALFESSHAISLDKLTDKSIKSALVSLNPSMDFDNLLDNDEFVFPFFYLKEDFKKSSKKYTTKYGDTLKSIAELMFKDEKYWGTLYILNKDKINVIPLTPGIELIIPQLPLASKAQFATFRQVFSSDFQVE